MDNYEASSPQQLIDHLFRHQSGKMVAVLSRIFGIRHLTMVEDVVQEAFLKAVQLWPLNPLPDNPAAWLMQTARNKAIDILRRQQYFQDYSKQLQQETEITIDQFFLDHEIADSQLRLIFACCHPRLKEEDQIALTLKTVSGFGIVEIAKALLTNEPAIQKRLYRARQLIKDEHIQMEIPMGAELEKRLESVYTVLYLLFNEGYNASIAGNLIRKDLCAEAMRLCLLLCEHPLSAKPASYALLSLMCFQASRFESRIAANQEIILLEQQDRNSWDRDLIGKGYEYLQQSSCGNQLSVYHIESAIAAEHCMAPSFAATNWQRMLTLYDLLLTKKNIPTVTLNRAIVLAQLHQTTAAIASIMQLSGIAQLLQKQSIFNAVLGELQLKEQQFTLARAYFKQAMLLTSSEQEKSLIAKKLRHIPAGT
jgi:RNA polymerase sigma-70 factor (ECF subfamily)